MQKELAAAIESVLPGAQTDIQTTDQVHLQARVGHASFAGLTTLEQHKLVYDAIAEWMKEKVHALTLETYVHEVAVRNIAAEIAALIDQHPVVLL